MYVYAIVAKDCCKGLNARPSVYINVSYCCEKFQ